jgi:thioredoxin-related protein
MKKIALALFVGILVLGLIIHAVGQTGSKPSASSAPKGNLVWHKYDEALDLAKEEDKHVLVYFTTAWCGYCKLMKKTTFTDPDVFALMSNEFVLAKVDGDSRSKLKVADKDGNLIELTERQLARSLGVRGYPTFFFLKPDGTGIAPISGYWKAEQFEVALQYISSGSYETMQFKDFSAKYGG